MNFEAYECSSAQRRLFILRQLSGPTTAFNISSGVTLEGKIERERFENAFRQVIRRHEALRTAFDFWNGQVIQKVYTDVPFMISERNADGKSYDELMHEFVQPFDLGQPPLLRAQIVRLEEERYLLLFDIDHIISDGYSNGIIVNELISLYAGKTLPDVECQYVDFVMWQNDMLQGEAVREQEAYWLHCFEGGIPVLHLPTDFPRPVKKTYAGANLRTYADAEMTAKIRDLGAKKNATLFMVLLAAYQVLLAKYSGDEDIVIGAPVVGRQSKELFNTVGIFVNTLPLRNEPTPEKGFAAFLDEVKERVYSGFRNQDYQLDMLVERLHVKRDVSRNPLFDVVFLFQNVGAVEAEIDGVQFSSCDFATKSVKYDLTLELHDRGDHLSFNWQYACDLFREAAVAGMAEDFAQILRQVVENPDQRIGSIMLNAPDSENTLSQPQSRKSFDELMTEGMALWQETGEWSPVYERIQVVARRRWNAVAIQYGEKKITYGELERRTERLAHFFMEQDIWNQNVLFLLGRSPEFVIAMLSVMRAGGIFAPMDRKHPDSRIAAVIAEIAPRWVAAEEKELERLERIAGQAGQVLSVLVLTEDRTEPVCLSPQGEDWTEKAFPHLRIQYFRNEEPETALRGTRPEEVELVLRGTRPEDVETALRGTQPGDVETALSGTEPEETETVRYGLQPLRQGDRRNELAYIYFTSGSTGVPKGIVGRHRSLAHFIGWELTEFGLNETCAVSQLIAPSFDACLRDILTPLCAGGRLCIPENEEMILDAEKMAAWIEEQQITLIHLTPAVFKRLLSGLPDGERFHHLQWMLLSGEMLKGNDVARWFSLFGGRIQLVNLYGATETTMIKLFYPVTPEDCREANIVVGKPMPGAEVWVLDDTLQPCRWGEAGHVYIRTPFMTAGYYNKPEMTQEVFRATPGGDGADLIYRTGDLGMILPDGNLRLTGRADGQVKIRGVRVEIAEIENRLMGYPGVKEAAVTAEEDAEGEVSLTGYLTLDEAVADDEGLRNDLRTHLPEYMIPAFLLRVETMPLNTNGKIDRTALKGMGQPFRRERTSRAAETELERKIAAIWEEVLEKEQVGIYDHFFDLGGHSLKAMQVVSRIRKECEVELSLADFFANPTIAGILKSAEQTAKGEDWKIDPLPAKEAYALSYAQQRLWLIHKLEPESTAYHLFGRIQLHEPVDEGRLRRAVFGLLQRHESLRTRFVETEGVPMQVIDPVPQKEDMPMRGMDPVPQKEDMPMQGMDPVPQKEDMPMQGMNSLPQDMQIQKLNSSLQMKAAGERIIGGKTVFAAAENSEAIPEGRSSLPFRLAELSHLSGETQEREREKIFNETVYTPFDIQTGPLFRFTVIRLAEDRCELIYAMHHIISDGWSQAVLQRDFEVIYRALKVGEEPDLPPVPVQYKDFAAWQNRRIADPVAVSKAQTFWAKELSGELPLMNLPRDLAYEALHSRAASAVEVTVPGELLDELKKLADQHHASLFMVMLATFEMLLWRVTNQSDLLIGIPTAGRDHADLQQLIGFFVNTNVLRARIVPEQSFAEFFSTVQRHTLEMLECQNYPLELAVDTLKIKYPPISVFFNMLNIFATERKSLTEFAPRFVERVRDVKFDLAFYLTEYANGLVIACHYVNQVFLRETVESMLNKYIAILQKVAAHPDGSLKELAAGKEKRKLSRA